mmetsp:Transcript_15815/g.61800  ORF Transcript_15815/g.61800 Transcript_15815/m.61800 type:complete len:213 (-) Transcript_15815:2064-2702(-)
MTTLRRRRPHPRRPPRKPTRIAQWRTLSCRRRPLSPPALQYPTSCCRPHLRCRRSLQSRGLLSWGTRATRLQWLPRPSLWRRRLLSRVKLLPRLLSSRRRWSLPRSPRQLRRQRLQSKILSSRTQRNPPQTALLRERPRRRCRSRWLHHWSPLPLRAWRRPMSLLHPRSPLWRSPRTRRARLLPLMRLHRTSPLSSSSLPTSPAFQRPQART